MRCWLDGHHPFQLSLPHGSAAAQGLTVKTEASGDTLVKSSEKTVFGSTTGGAGLQPSNAVAALSTKVTDCHGQEQRENSVWINHKWCRTSAIKRSCGPFDQSDRLPWSRATRKQCLDQPQVAQDFSHQALLLLFRLNHRWCRTSSIKRCCCSFNESDRAKKHLVTPWPRTTRKQCLDQAQVSMDRHAQIRIGWINHKFPWTDMQKFE